MEPQAKDAGSWRRAGRTLPQSPEGAPPCTPLDVSPVVPTLDCQPPELLCYQLLVVIAAVGN